MPDTMLSLRDATIEVIKNLPPSSSLEDIMYEINLAAQVLEGLEDEQEKRTVTTEELLAEVDQWPRK